MSCHSDNGHIVSYDSNVNTPNFSRAVFRSRNPIGSILPQTDVPSRFPVDRPIEDDTNRWWVLQSKPNRDWKLATYLRNREISYYMPLYDRRIKFGSFGRERVVKAPLFKGYLCVALDRERHSLLYDSHDFAKIIEVKDQATFVKELQSVSRVTTTEQDLQVKEGVLKGRTALITSGPLKGVEGIVVSRAKKGKFAISISMFNRTLILNVNPFTDLEIVNAAQKKTVA
jgi:transcription antitermination factor NusG